MLSCGNNHTVALMSKFYIKLMCLLGNGEVYTWGSNENGQCGTGKEPF